MSKRNEIIAAFCETRGPGGYREVARQFGVDVQTVRLVCTDDAVRAYKREQAAAEPKEEALPIPAPEIAAAIVGVFHPDKYASIVEEGGPTAVTAEQREVGQFFGNLTKGQQEAVLAAFQALPEVKEAVQARAKKAAKEAEQQASKEAEYQAIIQQGVDALRRYQAANPGEPIKGKRISGLTKAADRAIRAAGVPGHMCVEVAEAVGFRKLLLKPATDIAGGECSKVLD